MAVPAQAQAPAEGVDPAAFGPPAPQPFDFEQVATLAQERSARLYVQPVAELVGSFANLDYDQYRGIRFRRDQDPLAGNATFRVDLLSPGSIFMNRCRSTWSATASPGRSRSTRRCWNSTNAISPTART